MKRKHTKTTVGGILAAVGAVASKAAILTGPWGLIPIAVEAIGLALLGHSAADKPSRGDS